MLRLAAVACLFLGGLAARADDYPAGLIRHQLAQASRNPEVGLADMRPGELRSVEYVGRPVYVYRRSKVDYSDLARATAATRADAAGARLQASVRAAYASSASLVWARLLLVDQPTLEKRRVRSYRDEYLVVAGWSPRTGCRLEFHAPVLRSRKSVVFSDSCGGGEFDAAGRALRGHKQAPAEFNLYIPPHRFIAPDKLAVGLAPGMPLPELDSSYAPLYRDGDETRNLIIAARYGDRSRVDVALEHGADVNGFRMEDGSPLDAAIIGSSIDTVRLLIARGARPTNRSMRAAEFVGRNDVWDLLESMERTPRTR